MFSSSVEEHVSHLRVVLTVLLDNQLYAKQSKCVFRCGELEYLGHLILGQGVRIDPKKTKALQNWPVPTSMKALRGFLGLTGYYRKFIKDYRLITTPLTALLKKEAFQWSPHAELAFIALKVVVSTPPVLALPNFTKAFVVECDVSVMGLGAILMQDNRPLAYHSEVLKR